MNKMRFHKRTRSIGGVVFALALLLCVSIPYTHAIEFKGIGGRPAYPRNDNPRTDSIFVHTINPGEEIKDGIRVINNADIQKTLLVYAADSIKSSGGGFACKQLLDTQTSVGTWITLDKSEVILEPHTNEIVDFVIKAPVNAEVGEQNGCVLVQEKITESTEESAGLALAMRTGLRVALTIPGEIRKQLEIVDFEIKNRDDGSYLIFATVKNTGNVSIDAQVTAITKDIFGREIKRNDGKYSVLRDELTEFNFPLEKPFWGGWYFTTLEIAYNPDTEIELGQNSDHIPVVLASQEKSFFSKPSQIALIIECSIVATLFFIILGVVLYRRQKKWLSASWKMVLIEKNTNVVDLAKKYSVSWKLIVKVNKLKAPYQVVSGSQLLLPPPPKRKYTKKSSDVIIDAP